MENKSEMFGDQLDAVLDDGEVEGDADEIYGAICSEIGIKAT